MLWLTYWALHQALKAPLASPTFTGTFNNATAGSRGAVETSGAFGGAYTMLDGTRRIGWYSTGTGTEYRLFVGMASTDTPASKDKMFVNDIGIGSGRSPTAYGFESSSGIASASATLGVGYMTGAGGAVTQATNKATGVTLNKVCGEITMNGAALAAATIVSFTLTNSAIAATDTLILNHVTTGTRGAYTLNAQCAAGSAVIYVRNNTAGSLSEAIVIRFAVIKGVTA